MKKQVLHWNDPNAIEALKESLKASKVSLATSDTVLGLIAPVSPEGEKSLDLVKNRCEKPYIVLLGSIDKLPLLVELSDEKIIQFIRLCWPGPVTIIFKTNKNACSSNSWRSINVFYLKTCRDTIAIRIPKHKGLLELLSYFEGGLYSTSANLSGESVPQEISQVNQQIMDQVDCIVIDPDMHSEVPSTILDCTGDKIRVIREGAYPIDELEKLYGQEFIKGE